MKEQRVQIPLGGMSTTSTYDDGDSFSLVNLRPKNGALEPIAPRKKVRSFERPYYKLHLHKSTGFEHLIGLRQSSNSWSAFYEPEDGGSITLYENIPGRVTGVEQSGNLLVFVTDAEMYYTLWRNNTYTSYGTLPEIPPVRFCHDGKVYKHEEKFKDFYKISKPLELKEIEDLPPYFDGLVNYTLQEFQKKYNATPLYGAQSEVVGGYFTDAVFARYAFRLYDGTYIKQSPPILLMPPFDIKEFYVVDPGGLSLSEEWTAFLERKDGMFEFLYYNLANVSVKGYIPTIQYDLSGLERYKGLIESVDVFITKNTGASSYTGLEMYKRVEEEKGTRFRLAYFRRKERTKAEMMGNLRSASTFYKIRSLELGENTHQTPERLLKTDADVYKWANIEHQEQLPVDTFSHHAQGADMSHMYNKRLHLANTTTSFFKGFNYDHFRWEIDGNADQLEYYNAWPIKAGWGESFGALFGFYTQGESLVIATDIETDGVTHTVYAPYEWKETDKDMRGIMSAFISYPDPRAKRMRFYYVNAGTWHLRKELELKSHDFLNIAYFLDSKLQPVFVPNNGGNPVAKPDTSIAPRITEQGKLKVSEVNNPLRFPNQNVNRFAGEILAISSNLMNAADRNFGQFPLYVFTDEGVWAMQVGSGDAPYASAQIKVLGEAPVSRVVGSTPYGVVYIAKGGLFLINGQSCVSISGQIEENARPLVFETKYGATDACAPYFKASNMKDFLPKIRFIGYNPYEQELVVSGQEGYSFVYSFLSRTWHIETSGASSTVGNSFPDLAVLTLDGKSMVSYGEAETKYADVALVTRPLSFGINGVKLLNRVIARANLSIVNPQNDVESEDWEKACFVVHRSIDGHHFEILIGGLPKHGNIRDIDTGLLCRSKCRWFTVSLAGRVSSDSRIYLLDCLVEPEYQNGKLR